MAGHYKNRIYKPRNKKRWARPVLTVLVRANDGEKVLVSCKAAAASTGTGDANSACYAIPLCNDTVKCSLLGDS